MRSARRTTCRTPGCRRAVHPDSYYGRCEAHMWCRHCDLNEVRAGELCQTCRAYLRSHDCLPPPAAVELRRRRSKL